MMETPRALKAYCSKVTNLDVFILTGELRWQRPTLVQTRTEKRGVLPKNIIKKKKERKSVFFDFEN